MADGYTRSTGKSQCALLKMDWDNRFSNSNQNCILNYSNVISYPQAANKTMGQGGFQEVEQMNLFKDMVCYQEELGILQE